MNWIQRLFIRDDKPLEVKLIEHECKTCEVLKQQLTLVNNEKKELLDTITSLIKPKINYEKAAENFAPITPNIMTLSRRRRILEENSKLAAQTKDSPLAAKPDTIEDLEQELGITVEGPYAGKE